MTTLQITLKDNLLKQVMDLVDKAPKGDMVIEDISDCPVEMWYIAYDYLTESEKREVDAARKMKNSDFVNI